MKEHLTGSYMITISGEVFNLDEIYKNKTLIDDMLLSTSRQNRFAGHTIRPYSVLEHCILSHDLCLHKHRDEMEGGLGLFFTLVAIYCLIHDLPEAYTGDIIWPIKRLIKPTIDPIEDSILLAIGEQLLPEEVFQEMFGPRWVDVKRFAKDVDREMLLNEHRYLSGGVHYGWLLEYPKEMRWERPFAEHVFSKITAQATPGPVDMSTDISWSLLYPVLKTEFRDRLSALISSFYKHLKSKS